MNKRFFLWFGILVLALLARGGSTCFGAEESPQPLIKVMSFNIRYGTANDGTNGWEHRKQLVVQTIRAFDPDLLGMQEALDFQTDYVRQQLTGYDFHGAGREDGALKGEMSCLMYKTNRFEVSDSGHFWLSETPDVPGSISWDSSLPRMVSWVALRDKTNGREFVFGNTHFDHKGAKARAESAKLLRKKSLDTDLPLILSGDLNTTEDAAHYPILRGTNAPGEREWFDTFRVIHPIRTELERSAGGWEGQRKGSRIDYIFHTLEFATVNAMIDYTNENGRYPSDHFPVEAIIKWR